ncbi:hypothetical protein HMPREF9621_01165 [Cutibacterium modestum HL037PA2]|nr:hypothetical protein HMPREF9621_01165 [Cutibacterium modestum HL037PA2]
MGPRRVGLEHQGHSPVKDRAIQFELFCDVVHCKACRTVTLSNTVATQILHTRGLNTGISVSFLTRRRSVEVPLPKHR